MKAVVEKPVALQMFEDSIPHQIQHGQLSEMVMGAEVQQCLEGIMLSTLASEGTSAPSDADGLSMANGHGL